MSKKQRSGSNSDDSEVYEVQKIVNQRIINGKKQFKVIWTGYSFQEATWQPEENLKCPQKINEFLKRYQDVIRRKNLSNKNSNDINSQSLKKPKITQSQKVMIEKNQPILQRSYIGQSSYLNKQKLQTSLQKSSFSSEKRVPDIDSLKSRIMAPQAVLINQNGTDRPKNQTNFNQSAIKKVLQNQQLDQKNQSKLKISIENKNTLQNKSDNQKVTKIFQPTENLNKSQATKVIKIQNQSKIHSQSFGNKAQNKIQSKLQSDVVQNNLQPKTTFQKIKNISKQTINLNPNFAFSQIVQERKISSQQSQSDFRNSQDLKQKKQKNIFLKISQRLDIQKVISPIQLEDQQIFEAQSAQRQKIRNPKFFLIKNKFSEEQIIISRQRIIGEQPMELIEFYERLLMITQN